MLNNLVKLLVDTNRLRLDDIEYDKSIPIETNPELNKLELKLRKELAYINAMDLRCGNVYLFKSQFEPRISNRFMRKVVFKAFLMIDDISDFHGLPYYSFYYDYKPHFFKFTTDPEPKHIFGNWPDYIYPRPHEKEYYGGGCFGGYTVYKDPDDIENLYMDMNQDEYDKIYRRDKPIGGSGPNQVKKHHSKKWRNGKKK